MELQKFLYRGDSDPYGTRRLKETWNAERFLMSNLSKGGNPYDIFNYELLSSIDKHIDDGWQHTHFLSFSADYDVAVKYLSGASNRDFEKINGDHWDAVIFEIDTSHLLSLKCLECGIYIGKYRAYLYRTTSSDQIENILSDVKNHGNSNRERIVSIMLVDTVTYIRSKISTNSNLGKAMSKANRDKEWLILPLDEALDEGKPSGGLTSKMDGGCISNWEGFRFKN
ncbi:MAG: hypothetical protein PHO08_05390 [Methylococcales bacterium]|nr:hypothetical protein [Methylococcales bacterium]MDD5630483.1 hypothetical protein [Methylococcales bacterium]